MPLKPVSPQSMKKNDTDVIVSSIDVYMGHVGTHIY